MLSLEKNIQANEIVRMSNRYINESIAYRIIKRAADVIFPSIALIISIPIMIVACLFVVMESKGSPIFKQERLGLNGKSFTVYKIRSMKIDAENISGPKWAETNDPRVTRVGKFIRRTRIDEIPQIINILKGNMSMVGPRPEREIFYRIIEEEEVPGYRQRLSVKPGLTGYAQVNGGYNLTPTEKFKLDMKYIRERSLLTDSIIILKTVVVLFTGYGAR